jgi:DNA-binding NtrC family response regulator
MPRKTAPAALIVDDSKEDRADIATLLAGDYTCDQASNAAEAFERLETTPYQFILLDIEFEGGDDGFKILARLTRDYPEIPVIMVTKFDDMNRIIKAARLGAVHYVHKDEMASMLGIAIEKALSEAALMRASAASRYLADDIEERLIGSSAAMMKIKAQIEEIAPTDACVLITGETGTGKDVVARLIHDRSPRKTFPFVEASYGDLAPEFNYAHLFGHMKGAFTGADKMKLGKIEWASRGTLFLNEIGDINSSTQHDLLRVVEKGEFERLGSSKTLQADVRYVFATMRDIDALVADGSFRKDLYFRITAYRIHIPPLRERVEDIPALVRLFAKKTAEKARKPTPKVTPEFLDELKRLDWPGNVRQLERGIELAVQMGSDPILGVNHLRFFFQNARQQDALSSYRDTLDRFTKRYILELSERYDRDVPLMAKHAKLSERNIYRLLKKYGIS